MAEDALIPHLRSETACGAAVRDAIVHGPGYIVLPGVLSGAECRDELERMWGFVEKVAPQVDRKRPRTWYPESLSRGAFDPWPHTQKDRFQSFQAGWVFNELREKLVERVFEPHVFGTRELHCSKDGFTFHRPTGPITDEHGAVFRPPKFVRGPRHQGTQDDHLDQGAALYGLQTI